MSNTATVNYKRQLVTIKYLEDPECWLSVEKCDVNASDAMVLYSCSFKPSYQQWP